MSIPISEALPRILLRSNQIMWLVGAGASVTAGIPTAEQMIWDFKRKIYCAENSIPIKSCENLNDKIVRKRIQEYFNAKESYPELGSTEEYSFYFEKLYPSPNDRRDFIENYISKGKPSRGNKIFASLMKMDQIRLIWTTNFDRIIEDSSSEVFKSTKNLNTCYLSSDDDPINNINQERWPTLVKLHGDFQSSQLKNTTSELLSQDKSFRAALIESSRRFGIAVAGYSGRDESIILALEEALRNDNSFPRGIFWFHRPEEQVLSRVNNFILKAKSLGIDAHLVTVETFDELMEKYLSQINDVPTEINRYLDQFPRYCSPAPINSVNGKWPIIRFNALQILEYPKTSRLIKCDIGGQKEVFETVKASGLNIIAYRRRSGVFAFGEDKDLQKAFNSFNITSLDVVNISEHRLNFDSQELALLYEALSKGVKKNLPLLFKRKGKTYFLIIDKDKYKDRFLSALKHEVGNLYGLIPNTNIEWFEGIKLKIEMANRSLWLLIEPVVFADYGSISNEERAKIGSFIRERTANRYNKQADNILNCWINIIVGTNSVRKVNAIDVENGIDAMFKISAKTAFCWKDR